MPIRRIPKEIRDEVIGKAKAGEEIADLAKRYGISTKTIYSWLTKDGGEDTISALKREEAFIRSMGKSSSKEVVDWLSQLAPMETSRFIEEDSGNIVAKQSLKEDLLPPK